MANQKLYAGVKIRETRLKLSLTQKDFAAKLGVSLSYLNQMENNHRPISAGVVLAMAQEFGFDVTTLSVAESDRMVVDMREALADPVFGEDNPPLADLQLTASNAPMLARAFLNLHRSYRHSQDRLASLNEALGQDSGSIAPLPWEEVRDFFHYCDNYIDSIDRAAENFAQTILTGKPDKRSALINHLEREHGINVSFNIGPIRQFDALNSKLTLSSRAGIETQIFQLAHQIALLEFSLLLETTLDYAKFRTEEARDICKIGLANYFAGAAALPYTPFLAAAQGYRHDLDLLAEHFSASIEQVAHRLSTLQRAGQKGIPFFFVRVDQAGTITKRHSATRLQFARFGGACPLWNVHRAFETPNQYLRQLAETPDGERYFCLARDISKPGPAFKSPTRRFAIGLGCEISHADKLVYIDGLDTKKDLSFEPIGVSCRICERQNCHQRAVPPLEHKLRVNHNIRGTLPYSLS
ncbi:MAG: short-chain fatty acyl-CoA regulator family protein [Rhodobacteraceae bacterium]|nr:short-chain fatty acyl-CoA regulator family protein [Paracoccaceae bacterium]